MEFDESARLDTSQVEDRRSSGGGGGGSNMGGMSFPGGGGGGSMGLPKVGGGLGLLLVIGMVLFQACAGGGGGGLSNIAVPDGGSEIQAESSVDNEAISTSCQTGADANAKQECRIVADVNSIQNFWAKELPANRFEYRASRTVMFRDGVNTGCGAASSAMGPFYCPADEKIYLDLAFFDELRTKFEAIGGPFAEAYVIAHEYGHHVQDLLGTTTQVERSRDQTGPQSAAVRLELQADCYAGVWAANAERDGFIKNLTDEDIAAGIDAAARVGDDFIQKKFQGRINQEGWTHGSSAQRMKWFKTGLSQGNMNACDTFSGAI